MTIAKRICVVLFSFWLTSCSTGPGFGTGPTQMFYSRYHQPPLSSGAWLAEHLAGKPFWTSSANGFDCYGPISESDFEPFNSLIQQNTLIHWDEWTDEEILIQNYGANAIAWLIFVKEDGRYAGWFVPTIYHDFNGKYYRAPAGQIDTAMEMADAFMTDKGCW